MSIFENLTVTYPIFSLIFSLILMFGLYYFGEIICYNNKIKFLISSISKIKYQKIILACNFLMIGIFPIVLFIDNSKYILNFLSIIIFILGLVKIYIFLGKKKLNKIVFIKTKFWLLLIYFNCTGNFFNKF